MRIETFKKSWHHLLEANIVPMLIGPHGIGKSKVVKQLCDDLGYLFVDLRLGTQDVGDLIGLADFLKNSKGDKIATKFIIPEWLQKAIEYATSNPNSKAIIFLDEMNRGRRDVLQSIFQLVLDKEMHMTKLPDNIGIISACNPNTEDYIVTDLADKALIDRFCWIKFTPSTGEWLNYAKGKNFNTSIIDFIHEQPGMLKGKTEEFALDFVEPTPRSWEAVDRLEKTGADANILQELYMGMLGIAVTAAYTTHKKKADKPFQALDILDKYTRNEKKIKKFSDSTTETQGRQDLLHATCDNLMDYFKKNKKLSKKQQENTVKFLMTIPAEISWDFLRKAYLLEDHRAFFTASAELKKRLKKARKMDIKTTKKTGVAKKKA